MKYLRNNSVQFECGFPLSVSQVEDAALASAIALLGLPFTLFQNIDFKTTSSIIGAVFAAEIANRSEGIVNPIEKGHPDVVPVSAEHATEEKLRNFGEGLEIKCTIGNVVQGSNLKTGQSRLDRISGITWQAHHQEVDALLGLVWDFVQTSDRNDGLFFPAITGAFYSVDLTPSDWGAISGTTGRNTKVSGMRSSGKQKMGLGWVLLADDSKYISRYTRLLKFAV
jgi:hypothetical protein